MRYRFPYVGGDLHLTSSQPDTSPHCETTDTGWCITRCACLLPQLFAGYSLRLPIRRDGSGE